MKRWIAVFFLTVSTMATAELEAELAGILESVLVEE